MRSSQQLMLKWGDNVFAVGTLEEWHDGEEPGSE